MNGASSGSERASAGAAPVVQVLRQLRLRDYRNFSELDLEFPAAGALVIGENGSGKTNLLEAIYYLEVFRSMRGARDDHLTRFGADGFHVRGRFERPATGETREVSVGYDARSRKKRVTVDGLETNRLGDAIGRAAVVVFSPADVALVSGGPSERRRFLDIVLCLNRPGHLDALQRFRQALRQRNSLLRQGAAQAIVEAYDEGMIESAATVMVDRARWVAEHAELFARRSAQVGGRAAHMRYRPGLRRDDEPAGTSREAFAAALRSSLRRDAARERERGLTFSGPHRDDLAFTLEADEDELDLREFGSGGQQRTAAVALRMVEAQTIRDARGVEPIVLLDDVFAEFDAGRSARILELVGDVEQGQSIFTAPKESDVHGRAATLERWSIANGAVSS